MNRKNRKKRERAFLCVIVLGTAAFLTGCGSSVPNLKKLDNDAEAQYMADELLKQDSSNHRGLSYDHSLLTATPTPEVQRTSAPKQDDPHKSSSTPAKETGVTTSAGDENQDAGKNSVDFSELYASSNVDVRVVCCKVKKSYGGKYAFVSASKGNSLCVVLCRIKNNMNKKNKVSLTKKKIQYSLLCADGKSIQPQMTIIKEDMQFFQKTLSPGESSQAVLVFEVSKKQSTGKMQLVAENQTTKSIVTLK